MVIYKTDTEYTGIDLRTLPDGTSFFVKNGAWFGSIFSKEGQKHVHVDEMNKDHLITDDFCGKNLQLYFNYIPDSLNYIKGEEIMGKWILTKNRLPKEGEEVLVCYKDKVRIAYYSSTGDRFSSYQSYWQALNCRYSSSSIIYWMPLPKIPNNERIK